MYIVIEGVDKAGKSTGIVKLNEAFQKMNENLPKEKRYIYSFISEPLDRGAFKDIDTRDWKLMTLLFAQQRLELPELVKAFDKPNHILISDRSFFSSYAYQGTNEEEREWIKQVNKYAPKPDLVIYLHISAKEALKRKQKSEGEILDEFENIETLENAIDGYKKAILFDKDFEDIRFEIIDAEKPINDVFQEMISII